MFFKGLLFGIGWVVGSGFVVIAVAGLIALTEWMATRSGMRPGKPQAAVGQKRPLAAYRAKFVFFVRLPDAADERMELGKRDHSL